MSDFPRVFDQDAAPYEDLSGLPKIVDEATKHWPAAETPSSTESPGASPNIGGAASRVENGQSTDYPSLLQELTAVVNKHSLESLAGDTPDFLIAECLIALIPVLGIWVRARDRWYSQPPTPSHPKVDMGEKP